MKIIIKYFILIFIILNTFTNCVKQNRGLTIIEGVLSVGVEIGYPPMEYYDSDGITLLGFDIELTKALADKLGLTVNYIDTAWEGIFAGLETGKYDIAINITILPERQERLNFTKPYIDSSMTIIINKYFPNKINEPQDIKGYKAAFQGGTTAQYFAEKLIEQGISFFPFSYDKIINCFDDLTLGRVDLIIVDNLVASDYAAKELFEIVWQGSSGELIGICLRKENDVLTAALNNALDELFKDGTLLKISQKYFNRDLISPLFCNITN